VIGALLFDFNGTLSDDEPILCEIWQEIFAERGRPLAREEYFARLAGLSDPEIAAAWLGDDRAGVEAARGGRGHR
jgi:beta-phosphoglucomutase